MITHKPKSFFEKAIFWKGLFAGGIVAFVFIFLTGMLSPAPAPAETQLTADTAAAETVQFTMGTRLGPNQVEEIIDVYINGEYQGQLHITQDNPIDTLQIEVANEGIYNYRMNSVTFRLENDRRMASYSGKGTGSLNVQQGDYFSAYYSIAADSPVWVMSFQEE